MPTRRATPSISRRRSSATGRGGLILLDNVLAGGAIAVPEDEVPEERRETAAALSKVNDALAEDDRVDLAMLGIADGLTITRKR